MFPIFGNPIFARGLKNLNSDSLAHTNHLNNINIGEVDGVPPWLFAFPVTITNGQSGLHAWTEQEWLPTDSTRANRIGGRSGTVTGLDGATATNDPAHMPDESTLTGFPKKAWLVERISNASQGRHYEIIGLVPSSTVLFGQDSATTALPANTGYPTPTTIYSSLTSGISVSNIVTSGQFLAGKYHFAWYAAGTATVAGGGVYGNNLAVSYGAATTVYGPVAAYLVPTTSINTVNVIATGDGWIHNFVDSSVAFYVTASAFHPSSDTSSLNQVSLFSVMFAKFS